MILPIVKNIREYSTDLISDNLLFSAVFGSMAYCGKTDNDVDMLFVTKRPIDSKKKEQLIKEYYQLHKKFNLNPDRKYPGEYITENQLIGAENGRGFIFENNHINITEISCGSE